MNRPTPCSILAIENSGSRGSVAALCAGGDCVFHETFFTARRETGPIFSTVKRACEKLGVPPELVVVGTGPGSYNGLRAAISFALALSCGFGVPCHGECSLPAYDEADDFLVAGDARSGQFFLARVRGGEVIFGPELIPATEFDYVASSGPFADVTCKFWKSDPRNAPAGWLPRQPDARVLALAVLGKSGEPGWQPIDPRPIYLKSPHITRPSSKAENVSSR